MRTTESPTGTPLRYADDAVLRSQVLRPYRERCRYLKSAAVTIEGEPTDGGRASAMCEFEIPESCYIDDTGHFNSVEFNICYNQMFYYLAAKAVQDGLLRPFSGWTMDDYWQRQLNSFLITEFNSVFKRPMRGRRFFGEVGVGRIVERTGGGARQPIVIVYTECRFWPSNATTNERAKYCHGSVKVAITDPNWPRQPAAPPAATPAPVVQRLMALPRSERRAALEGVVVPEFRAHLLMSADEPLPLDANYFDLGLTSLQAAEIKQRLEALLGCEIDASALLGRPTIEQLVNQLVADGLSAAQSPGAALPVPAATVDAARVAARRPMVDALIQGLYEARS